MQFTGGRPLMRFAVGVGVVLLRSTVLTSILRPSCGPHTSIRSGVGPVAYQRRSNFLRNRTAVRFMTIKNASNTMMAAEVRSTKPRSGLSAHR